MSYANLFLHIWELGLFSLGNLAYFCLGTWTDFAWEVGLFLQSIFTYLNIETQKTHHL
jgi:hypothetical protein